jgi:hypothetical protein
MDLADAEPGGQPGQGQGDGPADGASNPQPMRYSSSSTIL